MRKDNGTHLRLWRWMIQYQDRNGVPPTLNEVRDAMDSLSHRSSARYILNRMKAMGMVDLVRDKGCARRYRAGGSDAGKGRNGETQPCDEEDRLLADHSD